MKQLPLRLLPKSKEAAGAVRFKYTLQLPCGLARLTLKLWDTDVIGASDLIGSTVLDLQALPPTSQRRRMAAKRSKGTTPLLHNGLKAIRGHRSFGSRVAAMTAQELRDALSEVRVKRPGGVTGKKLAVGKDADLAELRELLLQYSTEGSLASTSVRWPKTNSGSRAVIDWVSDSASCFGGGGSVEADAGKPPVRWVPLHAPSTAEEEPEGRGEMEVALELLHSTLAEKRPAGQGRKSPNQHPQLEEPDRVSMLSLANPVHALRSLIGPGAAKYVAAGLCCFAFCLMIPLILSNLIAAKLDSMTGR